MDYQVTVRFGKTAQRYLTLAITAPDAATALLMAAGEIPKDVVPEVDLVELREAPDFDKSFSSSDDP